MIPRPLWIQRLESAWARAPIVWLAGVRRSGKTTLVQALEGAEILNCDLPSVAAQVADPEAFYSRLRKGTLVLDEVHQLDDPSLLLKIGADTRPDLRIAATGSSTLAATGKFRDTLAGRKRTVHLLPVLVEELPAFGIPDLRARLRRGGLPQALLDENIDPGFYGEWMDSYFARDVQELFRVEKRRAFMLLMEAIFRQSGGLFENSSLARVCGLSRPTILHYLDVLETTHVVHILRPWHRGGRQELLQQPKIYGFDTGFVRYARGAVELRLEDCGLLWEHLVLDTLLSIRDLPKIHFWRDRQRREVDFVVPMSDRGVDAFECEWSLDAFDASAVAAFRELHPVGRNFLVAPIATTPYERRYGDLSVTVCGAASLRTLIAVGRDAGPTA